MWVGILIELYKGVHHIRIRYITQNWQSETKEVRNMNLILFNVWMYVKMNKLLLITVLMIFLGTFLAPVDGGTCVCTCSLMVAGTSAVSCSSCTSSYCSTMYPSSCSSSSSVAAVCSDAALPTPLASVMIASLLALFFSFK
jgi:hypothetical protein